MGHDDTDKTADNPVTDGDGEDVQVGSADPGKRFRESEVSDAEQQEIAEERERRLDPANRPPNSEVDNTDGPPAAVLEDDELQEDVPGSDPRKRFREMDISEEEQREIAEERERRLDPANRPPNSEVDNTHRDFDGEQFKD